MSARPLRAAPCITDTDGAVTGRGPCGMPIDPLRKSLWLRALRLNGFVVFPGLLPVPSVEELVEAVPGHSAERLRGRTRVECVRSGSETMSRHSDQTLDDFEEDNGAMEMLPGTHHMPRSELSSVFSEISRLYPAPLRLRRGDGLLRDGNTLHRGSPNRTGRPRPKLDRTDPLAKRAGGGAA